MSHKKPFGKGTLPYLGNFLTMVINHLLNGMILQVAPVNYIVYSMDTCCSYAHLITTLGSSSEVQYIQHFSIFIDRYLKSWKALGFHHVDPFLQRLSSYDLALSCKCSAVLFEMPTVAVSQIISHIDHDSSPMIQRGVREDFFWN